MKSEQAGEERYKCVTSSHKDEGKETRKHLSLNNGVLFC
jgi:hypothetical protein